MKAAIIIGMGIWAFGLGLMFVCLMFKKDLQKDWRRFLALGVFCAVAGIVARFGVPAIMQASENARVSAELRVYRAAIAELEEINRTARRGGDSNEPSVVLPGAAIYNEPTGIDDPTPVQPLSPKISEGTAAEHNDTAEAGPREDWSEMIEIITKMTRGEELVDPYTGPDQSVNSAPEVEEYDSTYDFERAMEASDYGASQDH